MIRFKLSPELGDGDSYTIVNSAQEVVDIVRNWFENDQPLGEKFTVEVVEMSDEDFDNLQQI